MNESILRIIATVFSTGLFVTCTWKLLGAMQQSGYKSRVFWHWIRKKENLFYNRLSIYALCSVLAVAITALCFSFLGVRTALIISAVPFIGCGLVFCYADEKYALKIPVKNTGRLLRLTAVYALFTACISYVFIAGLAFLSKWNGSQLYAFIAYVPFAIMPVLLPMILCLANVFESIFENIRNGKFIKRAGQVLDETKITRIGIVGSYGKTSVKNILQTILLEKYTVVATPESYNTPIGIAKTVKSAEFKDKQIFIAEMGARRAGDIATLGKMVKPDYAIFTGVCEQHIQTFGSLENVWQAKKEIFLDAKKVVCGKALKEWVEKDSSISKEKAVFSNAVGIKDICLKATETAFTLCVEDKEIAVKTKLLGNAAVENILLAVMLAYEMGLQGEEIASGIEKIEYVPHRLQLLENNGVYILDDGYNCNPKGAEESLAALSRFEGRKCLVTPGIVECGVLEKEINGRLGEKIAEFDFDKVILIGDTLVGAVKAGYDKAEGAQERLAVVKSLDDATAMLAEWVQAGDAVLFLNDLPDVY